MESQPTLACDLTAIPLDARRDHIESIVPQILETVECVEELADGYAFLLPLRPGLSDLVSEFVENERKCCSFIDFQIEIDSVRGKLWLQMTGGGRVKEFLKSLLVDMPGAMDANRVITGNDQSFMDLVRKTGKLLTRVVKNYI